jgi:hypothetical protein
MGIATDLPVYNIGTHYHGARYSTASRALRSRAAAAILASAGDIPMPAAKKTPLLVEQLRKELPRLLRQDAQLRGQIIGILSEYLTTREETAAILIELRQMRADFDRRMDEQGRRIEEHTRSLGSLERTLGAIGARWGMMSEDAFRAGVRALFAEQPEVRVESWRYEDREGKVFGHPSEIELDAIVRDGIHLLIEIKSSVSAADVILFARKADFYGEATGRAIQRRLIISPFVEPRAVEAARRLGIEVHAAATPPGL